MRRLIWNIYAWPVTLIILLCDLSALKNVALLPIGDLLISIPALVCLHLHIWDKKFLSNKFWKPYAFVFVGWDLLYNLLLHPINSGEKMTPLILVAPAILSLLYIALFRYAFRRWGEEKSLQEVLE